MSSTADVLHDLTALVRELTALLATKTAREIPNIARDLGAQPQLAQGVDALNQMLKQITDGVRPLHKTSIQADALVALLGCIPGFVASLGGAIDSSGDWLATLGIGLDEAGSAARGVSTPIQAVSGVLEVGVDVAEDAVSLLAPGEWPGLLDALDQLSINLLALKNPTAPTGAPSTGGTAP
ncbi:hypothetical protein [Zoogloea sp.]|uniref:hypothetical protein n=1 Tax=Zoogloea sp. TaxID=49181 RepID=UPI0035B1C1F9